MFKRPLVRVGMWLALAALFAWIYVESQRGPDYVAAIKQRLPAGCELVGAWRATGWPDGNDLQPTYALCDDGTPTTRVFVVVIGDIRTSASITTDVVERLDDRAWLRGQEVLTITPDGKLVISGVDEPDAAMTLQPIQ